MITRPQLPAALRPRPSRKVRQSQNLASLDNLDLSTEELNEIDKHAVESGIDLWATSRKSG